MGFIRFVFWALLAAPTMAAVCNVMQHGARGDGVTVDTAALRAAIASCQGGGTVLIPKDKIILTSAPRRPPAIPVSHPHCNTRHYYAHARVSNVDAPIPPPFSGPEGVGREHRAYENLTTHLLLVASYF